MRLTASMSPIPSSAPSATWTWRPNKRGRPYTLVCTKNQASFQRRVRQREQDLGQREQLAR